MSDVFVYLPFVSVLHMIDISDCVLFMKDLGSLVKATCACELSRSD